MISRCTRNFCALFNKNSNLFCNIHRHGSGYIVLLPEVDTVMADKLLSVNDELPAFSQLNTGKIGTLMGKQILDLECTVRNTDRNLEGNPELYPNLFEDALDPIEKATLSFETVWGILKTLYLVDIKLVPATTYINLGVRVGSARSTKFLLDGIYNACKKYDKNKLTEEQSRLVDKYLNEGFLNGLEASPKKRAMCLKKYISINEKQYHFRLRVETARSQFYVTLDDPLMVQDFPQYLLKMTSIHGEGSTEGPWTIKLNHGIGENFLEYCPDRNIRWMVWTAEDKAASMAEQSREIQNSVCLEEIRYLRYECATLVGYSNYVEAKMKMKMVGNVENLLSTLELFREAAKPAQYEEVVRLQEFADSRNFGHPLQLWDLPYWARRYKMALYNFEGERMRVYLQMDRVLSTLFDLCGRLFGLRFEEAKEVDCWHPDVRFYYVFEPDNNKPTAGFYFDPYVRETKLPAAINQVDVISIRSSSRVPRIVMPLTALVLHIQRPEKDKPALMSFFEVKELFYKFGHNLQYLLCKSSYSDLSGLNNVEFDAVNICSHFMVNWLYQPEVFDSMNSHYGTGQKIQNINLEGVRKHLAGYRLCKELYKANLDLAMHAQPNKFWMDITTDLWDDHFIFPMSLYHSDPVRYTDIFGGIWGGSYYSHIWSEMIAADVLQAFKEESDLASVGARFRDTFFAFGGSCHASEVFRRFRGRDPCPNALLEHLGLTEVIGPKDKLKELTGNEEIVVSY